MADRSGVPQRTSVLMDIRANVGGASDGYTGREGVPQDVDVLMDIREATAGGTSPKLTDAQQAAVDSGITSDKVAKLDGLTVSAVEWKGTVATVSGLPETARTGDVWHVNADGGEYAWDGSEWQEVGTMVDISGKQDRLTAGDGIQISGSTDSVTVPDDDTTYSVATSTEAGLMSAADKARLDGFDGITWGQL